MDNWTDEIFISENMHVNTKKISEIILDIKNSEIALPRMQREFVWNKKQILKLFVSFWENYPIGFFIFWRKYEIMEKKNVKFISKKETLKNIRALIIDGQQRLKTIWHVLTYEERSTKNEKGALYFDLINKRFTWSENDSLPVSFIYKAENNEILKRLKEKRKRFVNPKTGKMTRKWKKGYYEAEGLTENYNEIEIEKSIKKIKSIGDYKLLILELINMKNDDVQNVFFLVNRQGTKLNANELLLSKLRTFNPHCGERIDALVNSNKNSTFWQIDTHQVTRILSWFYFSKDPGQVLKLLNNEDKRKEFDNNKEKHLFLFDSQNWEDFLEIIKLLKLSKGNKSGDYSYVYTYVLYLQLKWVQLKYGWPSIKLSSIKKLLAKWIIFSYLTGRYAGSKSASNFNQDLIYYINKENEIELRIKSIAEFKKIMNDRINATFNTNYWNSIVPKALKESTTTSPFFHVYKASLSFFEIKCLYSIESVNFMSIKEKALKMKNFQFYPKKYLEMKGINSSKANRIGNICITTKEIKWGKKHENPFTFHKTKIEKWKTALVDLHYKEGFLDKQMEFHVINNHYCNVKNDDEFNDFLIDRCNGIAQIIKRYVDSYN